MDARCVFIDGPVAIYVQDASPAEIRHAYDRLRCLVSCMCSELERAELRKTHPLREHLPQGGSGQEFP